MIYEYGMLAAHAIEFDVDYLPSIFFGVEC